MYVQASEGLGALWVVAGREEEVQGLRLRAGEEELVDEAAADGEAEATERCECLSLLLKIWVWARG